MLQPPKNLIILLSPCIQEKTINSKFIQFFFHLGKMFALN